MTVIEAKVHAIIMSLIDTIVWSKPRKIFFFWKYFFMVCKGFTWSIKLTPSLTFCIQSLKTVLYILCQTLQLLHRHLRKIDWALAYTTCQCFGNCKLTLLWAVYLWLFMAMNSVNYSCACIITLSLQLLQQNWYLIYSREWEKMKFSKLGTEKGFYLPNLPGNQLLSL